MSSEPLRPTSASTRRDFLGGAAATFVGAAVAGLPAVHAGGSDTLKVGLVGCGGRGTGAARNALLADANVKLVALGDAFADRLEGSLRQLKSDPESAQKIDVKPDHCFVALMRITGEDPVPDEAKGDLDRMAEAWLSWGRDTHR